MDAATEARLKDCLRHIAPFSDTVQAVLHEMGRQPLNINRVCTTIELDPLLVSTILRLANSPFYGFARKITRIKDAAVLLGVHSLRQVVLSFSMVAAFPVRAGGAFDREALWRHSVAVGVAAKLLAEQVGHDPDEAFIAGLLHDIGKFILAQCLPEEYLAVLAYRATRQCPLVEAERLKLGVDHCQVGAVAVRHWQLPAPLAEALQYHCYPGRAPADTRLVDLVHLANVLVLGLWITPEEPPSMERLEPQVLTRLGLTWEQLESLLPRIDSLSQEMISRMLH